MNQSQRIMEALGESQYRWATKDDADALRVLLRSKVGATSVRVINRRLEVRAGGHGPRATGPFWGGVTARIVAQVLRDGGWVSWPDGGDVLDHVEGILAQNPSFQFVRGFGNLIRKSVQEAIGTKVVKTFTNQEDGVRAEVSKIETGYSVALRDLDSGEVVGTVLIYKELDKAIAKAKDIVR